MLSMKPLPRAAKMRPISKALLGLGASLLVFALLFDWNWVRPAVTRYLSHTSQRRVEIDDLRISFSPALAPTVRLRGVRVQNAPWADPRPLAAIGEVSFAFASLATLFEDQSRVALLVLRDADVDLERQADGLRNWRLRNPDYRGPGKYKVLRLDAQRTRVRFANREINLDVTARAVPAQAAASTAAEGLLTSRISFDGVYRNRGFTGELLTGDVLTLQETETFFPLRGQAAAGEARVAFDGHMADFFKLGQIDAQVQVSGPSLDQLNPFLRPPLPASRPFQAAGRVQVTHSEYAYNDFRGKLGQTDLAGSGSISRNPGRHLLRAALRSEVAHLADLTSLDYASPGVGQAGKAATPVAASAQAPLFSHRPLSLARLNHNDAQITWEAKNLRAAALPLLDSLRLTVDLRDGVLKLAPLDLGLAGGHAVGQLTLDGRQQPPAASAALDLRNLRLEKLTAGFPAAAGAGGAITAQVRLVGRGDSIGALLGNASGTLTANLADGRISSLLDAKLGLNGGKLLWAKLGGERAIAFNCANLGFDFRNGVGTSRNLVLDTERTRIRGAATINLRDEQFDALLKPQAKQARLIALGSAIHAHGSFRQAAYSISQGTAADDDVRAGTGAGACATDRPAAETRETQPGG